MTFNFTTRDWFWFCAVMALAIGWGVHARHTSFVSAHPLDPPQPLEDAIADYHQARADQREYLRKSVKLMRVVRKQASGQLLSTADQNEIAAIIKELEGIEATDHSGEFN